MKRNDKRLAFSLVCVLAALVMMLCAVSCSAANVNGAATAPATVGAQSDGTPSAAVRADGAVSGDLNGDGRLNARDVIALMRFLVGFDDAGADLGAADVNGDGKINARDVIALMKRIVSGDTPGESAKKNARRLFLRDGYDKGSRRAHRAADRRGYTRDRPRRAVHRRGS